MQLLALLPKKLFLSTSYLLLLLWCSCCHSDLELDIDKSKMKKVFA